MPTWSLLGGRGGQLALAIVSVPGLASAGCSSEDPTLMLMGALAEEDVWVRNEDVLDGTPPAGACLWHTSQYSPLSALCGVADLPCCEPALSANEVLRAASDGSTACSLTLDAALDPPPQPFCHGGPPLQAFTCTAGLGFLPHEIPFGWQDSACSPAWTTFPLPCCSSCCSSTCCTQQNHKQTAVHAWHTEHMEPFEKVLRRAGNEIQ